MSIVLAQLGRRSIESFFWRILGMASLFAMHAMLGRTLRPEDYGLFSFTLSIVTVLMLFTTMGWPQALIRLIPQYTAKGEWRLLKGVLFSSHQLSLALSLLFSLLLLLISSQIDDAPRSGAFVYAAILLPVRSLIMLRRSIFQGFHDVKGSILPDEVLMPGFMVAGLFLFGVLSVFGVVLLYLSTACVVFVMTLAWLWKILPSDLVRSIPAYQRGEWVRLTFPLLLGGLSQVILGQSGVFLLGMFGDMPGAGLFSASARIALLVTFVMTAINVVGMPLMATAFHKNDSLGLSVLFRKSRLWSVIGALPVFAGFTIFPEIVLSLFGEEFKNAAFLLQVLALGQLVNAAVGLAGSLLVVAGEEKYYMNSMMVTAVFCVIAMIVVIPIWGEIGAACIYSVSLALLSIMQLRRASRLST